MIEPIVRGGARKRTHIYAHTSTQTPPEKMTLGRLTAHVYVGIFNISDIGMPVSKQQQQSEVRSLEEQLMCNFIELPL